MKAKNKKQMEHFPLSEEAKKAGVKWLHCCGAKNEEDARRMEKIWLEDLAKINQETIPQKISKKEIKLLVMPNDTTKFVQENRKVIGETGEIQLDYKKLSFCLSFGEKTEFSVWELKPNGDFADNVTTIEFTAPTKDKGTKMKLREDLSDYKPVVKFKRRIK